MSAADAAVTALRESVATIIQSYLSVSYGFEEVQAANGRLQTALAEERERRVAAERHAAELADVLAAMRGEPAPAAFDASRVPLGMCPRCPKVEYSGQRFNMSRYSWGVDFAGDDPGSRLVFTHRECGDGDHSKDGV